MDVSFQLYSARNFTPWAEVLSTLADLGYTQVEGFGGVYDDPAGFKAALEANGLAMPSGHFSVEDLRDRTEDTIATAKALGVTRIYAPYLNEEDRPTDAAGWADFAATLEGIGTKVRAAGLQFGWHNHDFELLPLADGSVPMQIILDQAPSIDWEADIAWIVRGNQDPLQWIESYGNRIKAAHVKDIAPEGDCTDEDGWADVGTGTMDWKAIMAALRGKGVDLFVIEHDNPSDGSRFARRSIENFRNL